MHLNDPRLLRSDCYIDGRWEAADDGRTLAVIDPASGAAIADVPLMTAAETARAIEAAAVALPAWQAKTAKERAAGLRRWFELIIENTEDLAQLMTAECGKPIVEARAEVAYGASFVEWFAEEGKRAYGESIPSPAGDRRLLTIRQPIGVCAAITPWNFPLAMITRKVAPALAAGCTVVVKPAEQTPLTALALARLAHDAELPAGVFNVLTGDPQTIGATLTASPVVRKLSFTGSTEVGRLLMAQSAPTIKKLSLELGGNAPFIVFDDADVDAAVEGALIAKYRNTGQTCVCANRLLVQDGVYDAFVAKLARRVQSLRVGPGSDEGVTQGPLIDEAALQKVQAHIDDALRKGARVVTGGSRHPARRHFLRADGACRREQRYARRARRNLWPAGTGVQVCRGGGRGAHGQRHRVRSCRLLLFARRRALSARRRSARIRHDRHQYRPDFERGRAFRWRQAVGAGPRRLEARARRVSRDQVSLLQHRLKRRRV
jgi:succinate-semialdehyde dehydrogenase/glutarate-semialdehyde dehydrogenase